MGHPYYRPPSDSDVFPASSTDSSPGPEPLSSYEPSGNNNSSSSSPASHSEGEALEPEVEPKFIVFEAQLKQLMKFCPECGSPVIDRKKSVSGSHLTFHLQ
jgi:hypothetical protein